MGNPWRDCTEEEAAKYAPNGFSAPEGATNVAWSLMEAKDDTALPGTMVQLEFDLNGVSFTAREQPVAGEEITDISGIYYEWTAEDEGVLQNWGGGNMPCRTYRYIGEDECIDVCSENVKGIIRMNGWDGASSGLNGMPSSLRQI